MGSLLGVIMEYSKNYMAIPPGETIREQLEERQLSQKEFAVRMRLSEKYVNRLINGKVALTPSIAISLEDALGVPANFWLNLESSYRENRKRVIEERAKEEDPGDENVEKFKKEYRVTWKSGAFPDMDLQACVEAENAGAARVKAEAEASAEFQEVYYVGDVKEVQK